MKHLGKVTPNIMPPTFISSRATGSWTHFLKQNIKVFFRISIGTCERAINQDLCQIPKKSGEKKIVERFAIIFTEKRQPKCFLSLLGYYIFVKILRCTRKQELTVIKIDLSIRKCNHT